MTEKDIQEINNVINQYCLAIGSQIEKDFKNIFSKNKKCYLMEVYLKVLIPYIRNL